MFIRLGTVPACDGQRDRNAIGNIHLALCAVECKNQRCGNCTFTFGPMSMKHVIFVHGCMLAHSNVKVKKCPLLNYKMHKPINLVISCRLVFCKVDLGSPCWTAWLSGRTSVCGQRSFAVLRSICSWWVTTYVGKPSAIGQPTNEYGRTLPFYVGIALVYRISIGLTLKRREIYWPTRPTQPFILSWSINK